MERRNAEGNRGGARVARVIAVALIAGLPLGAGAAEVAEVRVGTHEKSTRIVLELDRASGYRLVAPEEGNPELQIHLDAASAPREVSSKSPLVRKVRVEPSGSGSTVSVQLATSNVAVKELLLSNPPRLVFDLTAQGPIPKASAEEPVAEKPAAPAPEPVEQAEPIVIAAAAEETKPSEPEPVAPAAEAPSEVPAAPATEPAPSEPMTPPSQEASPVTKEADVPPAPAPVVQVPSAAEERRNAIRAKAEAEQASGSSMMDLATSPLGIGAIGAAVLALGAIVVMRRRRANEDEDPLYTVMSAEDAGMADTEAHVASEPERAAAPIWDPAAFEASEPALKEGPQQLALGARPAPAPMPEPEPEEIAPPDDSDSIFASEPEPVAVAAPEPAAPMAVPVAAASVVSEETERRIAELERRIELLTEARERLERQVAAQTEELRVQRAAIARTQRVVRSIAKTEDVATEPVPRAPSMS